MAQKEIKLKPEKAAAPQAKKETYLQKYVILRKHNAKVAWRKMKMNKNCYLFLAHSLQRRWP